nr:unnamed protein product [Callosobruchus chinensis]
MHPRDFFSHQGGRSSYIKKERYYRIVVVRVSRAWNGLPDLLSLRVFVYSSPASTNFP